MKKYVLLLIILLAVLSDIAAEDNTEIELKLDFPIFDLPYQSDAAQNLEYGFFDSFIHPTLDQSVNLTASAYSAVHFGMNKAKDALGYDAFWKKLIYWGGLVGGDLLLFHMPIPLSYMWMHESAHRAINTHTGFRSHIGYAFPSGAYCVTDSGHLSYWYDAPRMMSAGLESETLFIEKLERNNFYYNMNLSNEFIYWYSIFQTWSYGYMPFMVEDLKMEVDGHERSVVTDSQLWVYTLFNADVTDYDEEDVAAWGKEEKEYLENRVMWSLVNFASPMMFGIRSIPFGDTGWRGNFAMRSYFTSFGTDVSVNTYLKYDTYNMFFSYHNYINYNNYFFAIEGELIDYPIKISDSFNLLLSPRIMIGIQPENQVFKTGNAEFFGLLSCRVDFAIGEAANFLPYLELTAKTDGWVAGNEFLEKAISFKAGLSMRF